MNNGSERVPEHPQRPQITNWIENVPVRGLDGEIIGRAKVSDKGEIRASIDIAMMSKLTYELLTTSGLYDGLSISPYAIPVVPQKYSEQVAQRLLQNNPFKKEN